MNYLKRTRIKLFFIGIPFFLLVLFFVEKYTFNKNGVNKVMVGSRVSTQPVLDIYLPDGAREVMAEEKNAYFSGYADFFDKDGRNQGKYRIEYMKSRGHNSFGQIKHGYSFKFYEDVNLCDMGNAKSYILLPCYRDTSMLSYLILSQMSKDMDFGYDLDLNPVHVNLNDEYIGLFLLAEKIEINPSRIDIPYGGAFLVELANRKYYEEGEPDTIGKVFITVGDDRYIIRDCTENNYDIKEIEEIMKKSYKALDNPKEIWDYWDKESLAKLFASGYIASEDGFDASIYFLYNPNKQKIYALPLWDNEHTFLPHLKEYTLDEYLKKVAYITESELYTKIIKYPEFSVCIKEVYKDSLRDSYINVMDNIEEDYIDKYYNDLMMDNDIYGDASRGEYDVDAKNEELKKYFKDHLEWFDEQLLID